MSCSRGEAQHVRDRSTFDTFRIAQINLDSTTKLYFGFGLDKEKTSLVLCQPGVIGEIRSHGSDRPDFCNQHAAGFPLRTHFTTPFAVRLFPESFVMSPQPEYLHNLFGLEYLINNTMLNVDSPGISTLQISRQSFEWGWTHQWILFDQCQQFLCFCCEWCAF